jgi:hypothetical protein
MPSEERDDVLKNCGAWRHLAKHVLIDDMPLERYSRRFRCNGSVMLAITLERLSTVMG